MPSRRDVLAAVGAAGAAALAGCSSGATDELCGTEAPPGRSTVPTAPTGEGPALPDGAAWPHPNGDAARHGYAAVSAPTDPRVAWRTGLAPDGERGDVRVAVGADRLLATDDRAGVLAALDPTDGTERWRVEGLADPTAPAVAPAGGDPLVLVGDHRGLHAFDPADGAERWSLTVAYETTPTPPPETPREDRPDDTAAATATAGPAAGEAPANPDEPGPAALFDAALPVGDGALFEARYGVHAVAPDGTERWRRRDTRLLAAADGRAYLRGPSDGLLVVDAATGERLAAHADAPAGPNLAAADGSLYTETGREVVAVDAADGAQRWSFQGEWESFNVPAVGPDAVVASASPTEGEDGGNLYVFERADGEPRWCQFFGFTGLSAPAVTDETVLLAGEELLVARSLADGSVRWRLAPDGFRFYNTPAVVDGAVYAGTEDGVVVALADG